MSLLNPAVAGRGKCYDFKTSKPYAHGLGESNTK